MRFWSGFGAVVGCLLLGSFASAATFGTGANEFTMDFVTISGDTNSGIDYDYRIGMYEITNDQWNKFKASVGGTVTGEFSNAYDEDPFYTGNHVPTNNVSWYEAAQFVNWLNTSTGHQAAYNFVAGKFTVWAASEAAGTNLCRHKDALYFLPSEAEWVKAAYWNGTNLQTYATKTNESLTQGDGLSNTGWNYCSNGYATNPSGPWDVGSGSVELNGTYDMMGNVWEWMESPYSDPSYDQFSSRVIRGGSFAYGLSERLASFYRYGSLPTVESCAFGFRVASNSVAAVPEPGSLIIWACGGLGAVVLRRRRQ